MPGDLGDPLYNMWVMNDNIQKAEHGFREFWDGRIFYPHRDTKLYADTLTALSAMAWPLVRATGRLVLSYNLILILSFFVCAWGAFLLVEHLTRSRPAGILAGIMFGFFPYRFAHIMHLELLYYAWIPLCLYFLHRYFERKKGRDLAAAAAMFVLQALSCAYYGLYFGFILIPVLAFFLVKSAAWRRPAFWLQAFAAAGISAAALLPVFIPYIRTHQVMGFERSVSDIAVHSAELQNLLAVPPSNLVWGRWLGRLGGLGGAETQLFPGLVLLVWAAVALFGWRTRRLRPKVPTAVRAWDLANLALAALGVIVVKTGGFSVRWAFISFSSHRVGNIVLLLGLSLAARVLLIRSSRERLIQAFRPASISPQTPEGAVLHRKLYGWLAAGCVFLSLGPQMRIFGRDIFPGPFLALHEWIPGFRGVRVPARFVVFFVLGLVVLAGMAIARYIKWDPSPLRRRAVLALTAVALLAESISLPIPLSEVSTIRSFRPIYDDVRNLPGDAVLVELPMPLPFESKASEAVYMYRSRYHGKRLLNGYSGYTPPAAVIANRAMDRFPTQQSLDFLAELGVGFILVHRLGFRPEKGQLIVEMMKQFEPRVRLISRRGNDFLYRLSPGTFTRLGARGPYAPVGSRDLWVGWASRNVLETRLAFDGNLETGWSTEGPQRPKDFYLLDLGRPERFSRLELFLNRRPLTFPRGFTLSASQDGETWTVIGEYPSYYPVLRAEAIDQFEKYKVDLEFDPVSCRYLKIQLTAPHPTESWTIQEIALSLGRIPPEGQFPGP